MAKLCGCDKPCGCGSYVLSQAPACSGYSSCDDPETCAETFDGACTIFTGDEIVNIGIPKGSRVNEIIQRLVGVITNPGCNYPDSPCKSVLVKSTRISSITITLSWGAVEGSPSYQIRYRQPANLNWTVNSSTTNLTDTIGGLLADTIYYVEVQTLCANFSPCNSVTLKIKTKIQ